MGDIMQHGQQVLSAKTKSGSYDFHPNYTFLKPLLKTADLAIANLELTLAGPPYKGYPQFSAPDQLAVAIKESGVNYLVTANNHSLDRRRKGLERTIDVLDSLQIPHTGTFKDSLERATTYPAIISRNGIKIALLNATYGTNGIPIRKPNIVNLLDTTQISQDIKKAKIEKPDLIIVFTHWGYEYRSLPNSSQKQLTNFFFKKGVNLVIGSHPHVLQPVEWRNSNQLVAYSLGNFISNMRKRYQNGGMILEIDITKSDSTYITNAGYHLIYTHTTPDPEHQYHLLPTSQFQFEDKIVSLKQDKDDLEEFVLDSRLLLEKNNLRVNEIRSYPSLNYVHEIIGWDDQPMEITRTAKKYVFKPVITAEPIVEKKTVSKPSKSTISFSIQVMATRSKVLLSELPWKDVRMIKDSKKELYKYLIGSYKSRAEAEAKLSKVRNTPGFEDAFIVSGKTPI